MSYIGRNANSVTLGISSPKNNYSYEIFSNNGMLPIQNNQKLFEVRYLQCTKWKIQ